jgi:putative hemolysin
MAETRLARLAGDYPIFPEQVPPQESRHGRFTLRFARDREDLDRILQLRYEVFNLEMGEGLEESHRTGRDEDAFDLCNHHLMVFDHGEDRVVGTYRMQTGAMAAAAKGFYSDDEFDLSAFPAEVLERSMELGRACVHRDYRSRKTLFLLWRGLARYVAHNRRRYLFGCSSLTSQDPEEGRRFMAYLEEHGWVHPSIRVLPRPGFACYPEGTPLGEAGEVKVPPLFRIYLRHGALACGPPAIDRLFKTIDFLVLFDVEAMDPDAYRLFFE